jgi:D-alanyl-D-alanine carboxypeptidase
MMSPYGPFANAVHTAKSARTIAAKYRTRMIAIALPVLTIASITLLWRHDDVRGRSFQALIAAYPDALARFDDQTLYWRDGTAMPLSDGKDTKSFEQRLRRSSIADQLLLPYPRGLLDNPPFLDTDPGRFRNSAFFEKMYGDCEKGEVSRRLVPLTWLPNTWGKIVQVTSINDVDRRLKAVSAEIDALPAGVKRAAYPIAGTYHCRAVADTGLPSPHSYGIAIDLNLDFSDYWYWRPHTGHIDHRNRMPIEIVRIFERHGFIWGGKWYHFDTMHFEYRPELLNVDGRRIQ